AHPSRASGWRVGLNDSCEDKSKTQNSKLRTQNSELKTQNSELRTQKLRTQNSKLKTQNYYIECYGTVMIYSCILTKSELLHQAVDSKQ
ncbi:MAG: hypothetical protein NT018_05450, partial [Armatimonadetes bacterium]|nr:hypothetical protein [Armatimonadota bacterium]